VCLYRRNWFAYYPIFIIATFNRETTCFLTIVYLLAAFRIDPLPKVLVHCVVQLLLWIAVKSALFCLYGGSGGELFRNAVMNNIGRLSDPHMCVILSSTLGFLWLPAMFYARRIKDHFVKRSLLVVPVFFVGMFCVGELAEIRIYGELIPVVLPAYLLILREVLCESGAKDAMV